MKNSGNRSLRAGLIGASIQASRTPLMHVREGAAQGLDYQYDLIDLDRLGDGENGLADLLDQTESQGYVGLNITHPCKQQVMDLLTRLSADSLAIGAVNTVVFKDRERVGENTDWWGYAEAFQKGLPDADLSEIALFGAGGAGAAVAYALLRLGAEKVTIVDTDFRRAQALADRMNVLSEGTRFSLGDEGRVAVNARGIVNATPMGMLKYPGIALDPDLLRSEQWVSDIVYVPIETQLLREARGRGCRVLDGSGMAVFQAVRAFELFTGLKPDVARMFQHFREFEQARV